MQNDHDFRFLATERVRELHREARSSHLADARLRLITGLWRAKVRAALRRHSAGTAASAVQVPSPCPVPASCDD